MKPLLPLLCERYPELAIEFVTSLQVGDLVSEGIDLAIRLSGRSSLVSRKLMKAPILTVASPRYVKRYGMPKHPLEMTNHRCLLFIDPHTGRPYGWPSCAATRRSKYRLAVRSPSPIRSRLLFIVLPDDLGHQVEPIDQMKSQKNPEDPADHRPK
jgi:DNA-binding transcriptional LysR family regulator